MSQSDPVDLLFEGMEKLGPGDDGCTVEVLNLLPRKNFRLIVDAGCGKGRQTLTLARELGTPIHAVDSSRPFLTEAVRRAEAANVGQLVEPHCMDMKDIPQVFREIDLLWSEGAAYNIGFSNALASWAPALLHDGFAVVSELSWLNDKPPAIIRDYFSSAYPDMRSVKQNSDVAKQSGYEPLVTYRLPRRTWTDDYYDLLRPRAKALLDHPEPAVREFANETIREIEIFEQSEDSYGYVFYVLQRS